MTKKQKVFEWLFYGLIIAAMLLPWFLIVASVKPSDVKGDVSLLERKVIANQLLIQANTIIGEANGKLLETNTELLEANRELLKTNSALLETNKELLTK